MPTLCEVHGTILSRGGRQEEEEEEKKKEEKEEVEERKIKGKEIT